MSQTIQLQINGQTIGPIEVDEQLMMIELLHEHLNLTGTKFGCGIGICHACVIVVDDEAGKSHTERTCITPAHRFNGKKVRTVEGHATTDTQGEIKQLSPVQQAFLEHYSFQCGWCTPGFVNEATALVERLQREPIDRAQVEAVVEQALGQHICRCTGYVRYYQAVRDLILKTPGLTL
ncbi:MAG: (2Fe-2S)-binding protein [Wenzhouxiangellaceae bacterium]